MYLREHRVRKPGGGHYTYYRLVESYREGDKVKQRVVAHLGALSQAEKEYLARRFAELAGIELSDDLAELEVAGCRYFGAPLLVEHLLEVLGLERWVSEAVACRRLEFSVADALKVMVCAHLFKSGSRAEWAVWEWQQKLFWYPHRVANLEYQRLLRSLAVLEGLREGIERKLYLRLRDLFDVKLDVAFYDLTSSYVEGGAEWSEKLRHGYSRDKRGDCKQVVIGVVVTGEGFPITFRVFEGNRLDKETLDEMVKELSGRFSVRRCIWVSDAGLLTERNVELLRSSGYEYIFGLGGSDVRVLLREAIGRAKELEQREFGETKFWEMASGERAGERVILVESEGRRQKTAAILERRLERVREGLRRLQEQVKKGRYVEVDDIRVEAEKVLHGSRVRKYFSYKASRGRFSWREDKEAVQRRKAEAGKYGILTNACLDGRAVLEAYRTLVKVEDVFLVLKDVLELRPFWHKCDENIEGHILLALWSYLVYKTLEQMLERAGVKLPAERALEAVKEVRAIEVAVRERAVWKLMRVPPAAKRVFEAVGIRNLKSQFNEWAKEAPRYEYHPRCVRKVLAASSR